MKRSAKRNLKQLLIGLAVAIVAGLLAWPYWFAPSGPGPDPNAADANTPDPSRAAADGGGSGQGDADDRRTDDANADNGVTAQPLPAEDHEVLDLQKLTSAEALGAVKKGNALLAGKKLVEGRAELSRALLSGKLPPAAESSAREVLTDLADRMIFSREIFEGDPYTMPYTFKSGEVLAKVERSLKLRVPTQIVLKINGIASARSIRAEQTVKVLRGPFHAIVSKSGLTMDLYLHREGQAPVYVRRLRVGLGKNGSTPIGLWQVGLGRKLLRAPWNPPPNATQRRSISWGQPGYPLGTMGYWLGLVGLDRNTRMQTGYGIHGTDDPSSIGRTESLGCVRLADEDIELVFFLLYEKWSTVRIRP